MIFESLENQKGQSTFEFIMFLPFMLMTLTITISLADSINGSINQQKVARGYFHALALGNSYLPRKELIQPAWGQVGMFYIGWKRIFEGGGGSGVPVAPCYGLVSIFPPENADECEESLSGATTTQHVRIQTAYGLCTTTYVRLQEGLINHPGAGGSAVGCTIR